MVGHGLRSLRSRWAVGLMGVLGLLGDVRPPLATPIPTPVANLTQLCGSGHWASPPHRNAYDRAPVQCGTCLELRNRQAPACRVYRLLLSPDCRFSDRCGDRQGLFLLDHLRGVALQQNLRFVAPTADQQHDRTSNCHFLLWALDPVIGVEDRPRHEVTAVWPLARELASRWIEPVIPDGELALLIQPATMRGQHQLHIHVGRWSAADRRALDQLQRDGTVVQRLRLGDRETWARFVPERHPGQPLSGGNPFAVAVTMLPQGERDLPRMGVAVALLAATVGHPGGMVVLAGSDLSREALVLNQPQRCWLRSGRV